MSHFHDTYHLEDDFCEFSFILKNATSGWQAEKWLCYLLCVSAYFGSTVLALRVLFILRLFTARFSALDSTELRLFAPSKSLSSNKACGS